MSAENPEPGDVWLLKSSYLLLFRDDGDVLRNIIVKDRYNQFDKGSFYGERLVDALRTEGEYITNISDCFPNHGV